jgi:pyruvate/2-oxoglutarate dehydrogenase complex dihydrolipoamide acyltransferase (E2) component
MTFEVKLPDLGEDTATEVVVSCWLVREGDSVAEGEDLLEVTTDKAAFTVPCPKSGTVDELLVDEGDIVEVEEPLCLLEVQ